MDNLELSKIYYNLEIDKFSIEDVYKLNDLIKYHCELYYNEEDPIISDYEYDVILSKLKELEKKFNIDNFSDNVGFNIKTSSFQKIPHSRPMISLDNTYNEQDLIDFDQRVKKNLQISGENYLKNFLDFENKYSLEFKFDGLGVELIYKKGVLKQALTRGDGIEGEDITQNVLTIENIPKKINYLNDIEVRGEVVMPISSFNKLNKESLDRGEKIFSNPRNAASGSLRLLDSNITKSRNLKFFAYDISNINELIQDKNISFYQDLIFFLQNIGFEISSYFPLCNDIENVIDYINNFSKTNIDFDIDGLVLKVNAIKLWEYIGYTAHHPKYAIAYKFPGEIATTKILSVEHQIGRTGTITPVANLQPINIGGVIVKRVTLHNYDEIKNLNIKIGSNVFIKRAGEVIPKIVSVVDDKNYNNSQFNEIFPPSICPSCGKDILKDEEKVRYYCPNNLCKQQIIEKIIYSVGKSGLNIDGLGKEQVELFYNLGFISNIFDIYNLYLKKEEILKIPGYKDKSVNNLLKSIENSKNQDVVNFIVSLNILGIGKTSAKKLANIFSSKQDFIDFKYSTQDLSTIEDIGEITAKNIYDYFNNSENIILLKDLLNILNINFSSKSNFGKFNGLKISITGSFENYSRDYLVNFLELNGGIFSSSITTKTDILLAGEKAGSKLEKAKNMGIKIININEFLNN